MFGQSDWRASQPSGQPSGHPLGPGFGSTTSEKPAFDFMDDQVRQASDLVDRHIADAARETAGQTDGLLGGLAGLYANANNSDLTEIVTTLTRTYADVAAKWVDLASTLTAQLGQQRAQNQTGQTVSGLGAAGPVLSIRAASPVEARVEMFRAAVTLSAQPLASDDPTNSAQIVSVKIEEGRLKVVVPSDQTPGIYYGLLLEKGAGPAGVVTVQVFEP